jgi:hypothetical protein
MTNPIVQKAKDLASNLSSKTSSSSTESPATTSQSTMSAKFPKTCKAITAPDVKQKLEIKEVPLEEPKEGEILVKVEACGVCHSDWAVLQGDFGPL